MSQLPNPKAPKRSPQPQTAKSTHSTVEIPILLRLPSLGVIPTPPPVSVVDQTPLSMPLPQAMASAAPAVAPLAEVPKAPATVDPSGVLPTSDAVSPISSAQVLSANHALGGAPVHALESAPVLAEMAPSVRPEIEFTSASSVAPVKDGLASAETTVDHVASNHVAPNAFGNEQAFASAQEDIVYTTTTLGATSSTDVSQPPTATSVYGERPVEAASPATPSSTTGSDQSTERQKKYITVIEPVRGLRRDGTRHDPFRDTTRRVVEINPEAGSVSGESAATPSRDRRSLDADRSESFWTYFGNGRMIVVAFVIGLACAIYWNRPHIHPDDTNLEMADSPAIEVTDGSESDAASDEPMVDEQQALAGNGSTDDSAEENASGSNFRTARRLDSGRGRKSAFSSAPKLSTEEKNDIEPGDVSTMAPSSTDDMQNMEPAEEELEVDYPMTNPRNFKRGGILDNDPPEYESGPETSQR